MSEKMPRKRVKPKPDQIKRPAISELPRKRRRGGGMPAFQPTEAERRQVEALSGYGIPQEQIAALIRQGIDSDTLAKHFKAELITGRAKANAGVGRTLHQKAMSGDTAAMIWWSKAQMRWAETQKHELSGRDGAPIEVSTLDAKRLSTEALREIMAAKDAAKGSN